MMTTNDAATRAATALLDYRGGTSTASMPVRDLCRRLWDAVPLDAREGVASDSYALADSLESLAARDAGVRSLLRDLSRALGPGGLPSRESRDGGGMNVKVDGNGNTVITAGRDAHFYGPVAFPPREREDPSPPPRFTVLFAAASPEDQDRARVDRESREIGEALERSGLRGEIDLQVRMAVRPRDFLHALVDLRPRVVHFAGHGDEETGELCFEDDNGLTHLVAAEGLRRIFAQMRGIVECVVLNACHSRANVDAVLGPVRYVIAMKGPLEDDAAIDFSTGFYKALGAGHSVPEAFELGCGLVEMSCRGENLPELFTAPG